MSKPMLIEALKPGMRAKVRPNHAAYVTVERHEDRVVYSNRFEAKDCGVSVLTSTDYEIILDDPKPWAPTEGDMGYTMCRDFDTVIPCEIVYAGATKTIQAAAHKAKLDRIFTAILNMPGYGGEFACVHLTTSDVFIADGHPNNKVHKFNFDTIANARAAAKYANKLMEASHA